MGGRKGRNGLFPATACIKLTGIHGMIFSSLFLLNLRFLINSYLKETKNLSEVKLLLPLADEFDTNSLLIVSVKFYTIEIQLSKVFIPDIRIDLGDEIRNQVRMAANACKTLPS